MFGNKLMWLSTGLVLASVLVSTDAIKLFVNSSERVGELKHFWESTGFCPPEPHLNAQQFDLSNDMVQNLAMIGAIPQGGVKQVRIHWLLDLVTVQSHSPFSMPVYNFTHLDMLIDLLYQNGLRPGFELMGNPSNFFKSFEDKTALIYWKDLVRQTAQRYIDEYGLGYVIQWNFETWNEPDCHDFDNLNITIQGFLNYYDACSEGLKAASPLLKFGGPGDGCRHKQFSDALLDHVVNGINYFTGEWGVRIDFLAYHEKGGGSSETILTDEIQQMKNISSRYPSLANKPFYNDEADPLVGWSKDEQWRADTSYAAMVAKIISQHQNAFMNNPSAQIKNYTLLSNDNGFLSWYPHQFTQRTLLARFQMNNTSPPHTHFFQKPVYSVMGLLALLGEIQVKATLTDKNGVVLPADGQLGVMASIHVPEMNNTADSWQSSFLVYYGNDTYQQSGHMDIDLYMDIQPPSWASSEIMFVSWIMDNSVGNPYVLWEKQGKPNFPTIEQMNEMRVQEGAIMLYISKISPGYQQLASVNLAEPSVLFIHLCTKPALQPDQVTNVNVHNITGGQVLITWSDECVNSRCILTYQVVFSKTGADGTYTKITPDQRIKFSTAFVYMPVPKQGIDLDQQVLGYYKVRAMDYFGNFGEYSLPTQYPS